MTATSVHDALPEISIDRLAGLGDGMGSLDGQKIIVPKTVEGDRVAVRVLSARQDMLHAKVERVLTPGPARMPAPCPHYAPEGDNCGGCALQHLSQDAYRAFKHTTFAETLRKAGFAEVKAEMVFLPAASRRRVTFTLMPNGQLAFQQARSHELAAIRQCLILTPRLQALLPAVQEALRAAPPPPPATLHMTETDSGIDLFFILRESAELAHFALLPDVARVSMSVEGKLHILAEHAPVTLLLGERKVGLPPGAFLQATAEGQRLLTAYAMEALSAARSIADCFAGLGTYGFPLSEHAKVQAFEGDAAMAAAMREAGLAAMRRDLFREPLSPRELNAYDAVLLNPPRNGAKAQCEAIAASTLPRAVMISCNPATFVRDANILREAGFQLHSALGLDQFVWSAHLELAACFTR